MRVSFTVFAGFFLISILFGFQVTTTTSRDQVCSGVSQTRAISVSSSNQLGNGRSSWPAISKDGRFITFESLADNLVPNDTNSARDVFLYDRQTVQTSRISMASSGEEGNAHSFANHVSADGRFITFESWSSNLTAGASGNVWDTFLRDQQTGEIVRISRGINDTQSNRESTSPSTSADGRYVVFDSKASNLVFDDSNAYSDIFLVDRIGGGIILVSRASDGSPGNGDSVHPTITSDGRYVAFISTASSLVSGDGDVLADIFVYDIQLGLLRRVAMASNTMTADRFPTHISLSDDGRYLAFESEASNLVPGDTNGTRDIFVYDLQLGLLERVSLTSGDGQANGDSTKPNLSSDGRYVVFQSTASNLVPGDTNAASDIFVRDLLTEQIIRVSVAGDCSSANGPSYFADISGDGKYVVFVSEASNLIAGDTNLCGGINCADVFLAQVSFLPVMDEDAPNAAPQTNFFTEDVTLTWNRVSWAAQYHVQISSDKNFLQIPIVDQLVDGSTLELTVSDLAPGTYYWRVQAQRLDGSWAVWSRAESFTVGI